MTECNGCGACCHPFQMVHGPLSNKLGRVIQHDGSLGALVDPDELAFAREHLTPISRREGLRLAYWSSGFSEMIVDGKLVLTPAHYYKCDRYDVETRRCTDYDHRPDCCRQYPWYGRAPDPRADLPPTCSFNADVGRPVEPIPVELPARRVGGLRRP